MESYDFPEKDNYRVRSWNQIDRFCHVPIALRRVAILDTREALETIVLLRRGYRPENIFVLNDAPVEVALLSRKLDQLGLPRVNTIGVDWRSGLSRLSVTKLDIVNFDSTYKLGYKLRDILNITHERLRPDVIAVNMVAGREDCEWWDGIEAQLECRNKNNGTRIRGTTTNRSVRESHHARAELLVKLFGVNTSHPVRCMRHINDAVYDTYVSTSGQPMLWTVMRVSDHEQVPIRKAVKLIQRCFTTGRMHLLPHCVHQRMKTDVKLVMTAHTIWNA